MTNILGLNYIFHDSSACLLKDGVIAYAVEEERLARAKHCQVFPTLAIAECLRETGTTPEQIDHIAISINPEKSIREKLSYASTLGEGKGGFLEYEFKRLEARNLAFWDWYHEIWPPQFGTAPVVHFVDHHLAHAAGTFYVSPWDSAALLSVDGWGEWATTWLGRGTRGQPASMIGESRFPNSLGAFYSAARNFVGSSPTTTKARQWVLHRSAIPCASSTSLIPSSWLMTTGWFASTGAILSFRL